MTTAAAGRDLLALPVWEADAVFLPPLPPVLAEAGTGRWWLRAGTSEEEETTAASPLPPWPRLLPAAAVLLLRPRPLPVAGRLDDGWLVVLEVGVVTKSSSSCLPLLVCSAEEEEEALVSSSPPPSLWPHPLPAARAWKSKAHRQMFDVATPPPLFTPSHIDHPKH